MAKQTIMRLVDDLDGGDADTTINFALDGIEYTIDLSEKNAEKLRAILYPFIAGGRRDRPFTPRTRPVVSGSTKAVADREALAAVRRWAADNGYKVAAVGRVSGAVMAAYRAAMREVPL
jgi:hypothetical protein